MAQSRAYDDGRRSPAAVGMEVVEREAVRGTVRVVYEIRCDCRRRWFVREFASVHLCPRCNRAVVVGRPA